MSERRDHLNTNNDSDNQMQWLNRPLLKTDFRINHITCQGDVTCSVACIRDGIEGAGLSSSAIILYYALRQVNPIPRTQTQIVGFM